MFDRPIKTKRTVWLPQEIDAIVLDEQRRSQALVPHLKITYSDALRSLLMAQKLRRATATC